MTRTYSTGGVPATSAELRALALAAEQRQRNDTIGARDLECRICAALLSHHGWEYVPARPYEPPIREGRKIVKRAVEGIGPRIRRHYSEPGDGRGYGGMSGSEEAPAPQILTDIGQAFGLLHGRVLIHLSDITADGLNEAHVGGGENMMAKGSAHGGATIAATLVAAILRCEAEARGATP
jgi:hypothetical protein